VDSLLQDSTKGEESFLRKEGLAPVQIDGHRFGGRSTDFGIARYVTMAWFSSLATSWDEVIDKTLCDTCIPVIDGKATEQQSSSEDGGVYTA